MIGRFICLLVCIQVVAGTPASFSVSSQSVLLQLETKMQMRLNATVQPIASSCPTDLDGLDEHYQEIFPTGNRNAASYKWFSYIAECAKEVGPSIFETLGTGFCPISGSPISGDNGAKVNLNKVDGGSVAGFFHFCCDPCVCDMIDKVKVDVFSIQFENEVKEYNVLVHGDPCKNKDKLKEIFKDPFSGKKTTLASEAPEIACDGNALKGATFSKKGHPIIGLFYGDDAGSAAQAHPKILFDGTTDSTKKGCEFRAKEGFQSGMGLIFRQVASITPV